MSHAYINTVKISFPGFFQVGGGGGGGVVWKIYSALCEQAFSCSYQVIIQI